jgi:hypothetical protein
MNKIINTFEEFMVALGVSAISAVASPEVIHGLSVLITSFLGTIVIHFTRKFLNKK